MQQHRKIWLISAVMAAGLAGCGGNDEETARQDQQQNETMPMGYYSNENHENRSGTARIMDGGADNEGPAVEMMDRTFGKDREKRNGLQRVNYRENQGGSANGSPENMNSGDALIGASDKNYHGHIKKTQHPVRRNADSDEEENFSSRISQEAKEIENVKDAQTVVYENHILIAVRLKNEKQAEETKQNIQQAVEPLVNGRESKIMTNESQYNRLKVIRNELRNGGPKEQVNEDLENILQMKQENQ